LIRKAGSVALEEEGIRKEGRMRMWKRRDGLRRYLSCLNKAAAVPGFTEKRVLDGMDRRV